MKYNITITSEPEYMLIDDSFSEAEDVAWVKQQLKDGNQWAWCFITVTLEFPYLGITLSDSLSGCSYDSEEQFKESGDYDNMVVSLKHRVVDACVIIVQESVK